MDKQLPQEIIAGDGLKVVVKEVECEFVGFKKGNAIEVTAQSRAYTYDGDEKYCVSRANYFPADEVTVALTFANLQVDCIKNYGRFSRAAIERIVPALDEVFEREV